MSDVTRKYLDNNQSDMEEGEIIDDNTYDNISSDEELTLRQRITELEERNMELERIADLSHTYDYGLDYGSGTTTVTSIPGTTSGSLLDNQKLIGRYETKYKNLYNKKIAYQSNSKKHITITKVNNYYQNKKVRRKNSITANSKKMNNYKVYIHKMSSSDTEDDSKSTREHKKNLFVALNHKTGTTPVTAKTSLKKKLINMNKNNKHNNDDIVNKNESDKDSDLELRLIALKSALVKKYGTKRRTSKKAHIVEERPYSPTDLLDKLTEQSIINDDSDYMDISPVESPRDNSINENNIEKDINADNSDCILQPVDMDLVNSDSNNSIHFTNSINSDWLSISDMPLASNFFMHQQTLYNHQFNHYQEQYFNNNEKVRTEEDDDEEALRLLLLSKKDISTTPLNNLSPRNFHEDDNDKYKNFNVNVQNNNNDFHEKDKIEHKAVTEKLNKSINLDTSVSDVALETDCLRNLLLSMMKKKNNDIVAINNNNNNNETNNSLNSVNDGINTSNDNNCLVESINENSNLLKDDNYNCHSKENSNFPIENINNNNETIQSNLPLNSFENILSNQNFVENYTKNVINNNNKETNTSAIVNDVQSQSTINAKVVYSKRKIVNQSKLSNNTNNKLIKLSNNTNNNNKTLPINVNDIQIPIVKPIIFSINDNSSDTDDENQSISDNSNIRIDYNKSPISIQMESSLYSPSSSSQHLIDVVPATQSSTINLQQTNCINGNKENFNKSMLINNKPEFEEKLEEYLQNARNKVEQKLLNTNSNNNNIVTTTVIDNKVHQQPVTPLAVRHLPQSSQLEYRRLVNRMSILERQKQYKLKKYLFGKELNKTIKDNHKKLINVKRLKTAITTTIKPVEIIPSKDISSTNVPVNSILNEDKNLCDNNILCCNNTNNNNSNNIDELKNDKVNTNNNCDNLLINQSDCVKNSATLLTDIDKLIKLINKTDDENNKIILIEKNIEKLYNDIKLMKNNINIHKNNIKIILPKIKLKNENLINMENNLLKKYNNNNNKDSDNNNNNNNNNRLPKSMKNEIINKIKLLKKENCKLDSENLKTIFKVNYNLYNYDGLIKLYENFDEINDGNENADDDDDEENHEKVQNIIVNEENLNQCNLLNNNRKEIQEEKLINNHNNDKKEEEKIIIITNQVARSYQSPLDSLNSFKVIRNPDGVICPFQLMGQCEDKECKYEHL